MFENMYFYYTLIATQSNMDKLQAVHNLACRIVIGAGRFRITSLPC